MQIEPIVFFGLIITIFILNLVLLGIVVSYGKTLKKFQTLQKTSLTWQKKESDIESDAYKKASLILEEARNEAIKIMADTNLFQDRTQKIFNQALDKFSLSQIGNFEKASYDFLAIYQKELGELKENTIKRISNISKDIENSTLAELNDFREILKKETFASQKIVEGKIEEDYKTTQNEIEAYKLERFKKIEGQIYEIIQNVSKIVLGKTLSLQEHEQLVIDALNKAKQEGTL